MRPCSCYGNAVASNAALVASTFVQSPVEVGPGRVAFTVHKRAAEGVKPLGELRSSLEIDPVERAVTLTRFHACVPEGTVAFGASLFAAERLLDPAEPRLAL